MSYHSVHSQAFEGEESATLSAQSEDQIVSEIEYAIGSIEKTLERWEHESNKSPIRDALLPIAILSSTGYLGSILPRNNETSASSQIATLAYVSFIIAFAAYCIFYIIKQYKDRQIKIKIMISQIDGASETLQSLRSWIDRSEMSYRLKALMKARAVHLEALVLQARYISKRRR